MDNQTVVKKMTEILYSIAEEFTPFPAGRTPEEGDFSGQAFRKVLTEKLQKLKANDKLVIDLHGLKMAGSSFLEEAFGGLVRLGIFSAEMLHDKMSFATDKPFLIEEIWLYIDRAEVHKKQQA